MINHVVSPVGRARGPVFVDVDETLSPTASIGEIPQVNETFGYLDGIYGILNEHQLAFGEGTCPGRLIAAPRSEGGEALFDITMLSRIAMQRCKTAREAILLMGQLAETHGYYGDYWASPVADDSAGETLTIADLVRGGCVVLKRWTNR